MSDRVKRWTEGDLFVCGSLNSNVYLREAEGRKCVADFWDFDTGLDECQANARLFMAAPDLVEALENLLAVRRGDGGTLPNADEVAEAALAKAYGEQR